MLLLLDNVHICLRNNVINYKLSVVKSVFSPLA